MDGTGAGTAIMLAVAAVLWFLYLVPTWLRRREYLATERTATRLQQTIRVLAETAEMPDAVRVAATAREAARQERMLRAQERRADAMAARQVAAVRRETPASAPRPNLDPDVLRRRRMRRTRLGASLLMVAATVVALTQVWLIATTGMTLGAVGILAVSAAGGAVAIAVQRRLDARAMPRAGSARPRTAVQVRDVAPAAQRQPWTPVEMPRPMYLSRPAPEPLAPRPDLAEALRAAAAEAEATLRAAQTSPEVVRLRSSRSSKYAGMGVLGPDAVEATDLDEVLRRRRSAG
ncbi:hypothetical protein [Pseudolysinimonas sp.]|uniref:hypothetical protein n=1 Tax=Pseudolysinimonas sp. TaxID=2680009 RepID=UPI00286A3EC1|nr:hypothetical protein [Pseudolysinimonas sp.]